MTMYYYVLYVLHSIVLLQQSSYSILFACSAIEKALDNFSRTYNTQQGIHNVTMI